MKKHQLFQSPVTTMAIMTRPKPFDSEMPLRDESLESNNTPYYWTSDDIRFNQLLNQANLQSMAPHNG